MIQIQLSDRQKKLVRWVGYPVLALFVFVFALFYTFPYEQLRDKLVEQVSQRYDITIASIGPTLVPGGIVLESVTLQDRPEDPDQVPSMMFFDEIEVDVGLLALLFGRLNVDLVAETASGTLEGSISSDSPNLKSASELEVEVKTEGIQLGGIPGVREGVGLPVTGGLDAELKLVLPEMKFANAEGYLRFKCANCSIGDGVSKIKPRLPESKRNDPRYKRRLAMYGDGLTVPQIALGAAEASIVIDKGVGKIEKLSAVSPDGELVLTGEIKFADPFKNSTLPGCLRFRISEELKKREKDFGNIDLILDAKRDDEGFFSFPTKGKLTTLQWDTRKPCKGIGGDGAEDGIKVRPTISSRQSRPTPQDEDSEAVRRAAGKDADEPEVTDVRASGPTLGQKQDAGTPAQHDDVGSRTAADDGDERGDDGDRGGNDDRGNELRGDDDRDDDREEEQTEAPETAVD